MPPSALSTGMLKMKPHCEKCGGELPADSDAFICSYECTFCDSCTGSMDAICPNCGGELVRRPRIESESAEVSTHQRRLSEWVNYLAELCSLVSQTSERDGSYEEYLCNVMLRAQHLVQAIIGLSTGDFPDIGHLMLRPLCELCIDVAYVDLEPASRLAQYRSECDYRKQEHEHYVAQLGRPISNWEKMPHGGNREWPNTKNRAQSGDRGSDSPGHYEKLYNIVFCGASGYIHNRKSEAMGSTSQTDPIRILRVASILFEDILDHAQKDTKQRSRLQTSQEKRPSLEDVPGCSALGEMV